MSTPTPIATAAPRRMSGDDALALWRRYKAGGDRVLRDRLILTFAPMVKYIVFKKVREIPAHCDVEDFISCGLEALIHSIDRYDPAKGATLEQYAWTRVHGAVLDELRRQDWAPRSVRRWERDLDRTTEGLTTRLGRRPDDAEVAEAAGIELTELRERRDAIERSDLTSLNTIVTAGADTTIERMDTLPSTDERCDPVHNAARQDAKERFRAAFATLPRREREVAVLLYVKHLNLREVGTILGVSESRVCQIHTQLKSTLRRRLGEHRELLELVA